MLIRISTHSTLLRRFLQTQSYFPSPAAVVVQRRHRHSSRGQMMEVDLHMSSPDGEAEPIGVKKLGDLIHQLIVLKSTPDWLPFLPGSSFWVPPRTDCRGPSDVAQLMVQMANHGHKPVSGNNPFSISSFQGRPSSSFSSFSVQGAAHRHPSNVDVEESEEVDDDDDGIELMLDEVEAEVEILEAEARARAEAEAEAEAETETETEEAQIEAELVAEAATESKSLVPNHSWKTPRYENEEG